MFSSDERRGRFDCSGWVLTSGLSAPRLFVALFSSSEMLDKCRGRFDGAGWGIASSPKAPRLFAIKSGQLVVVGSVGLLTEEFLLGEKAIVYLTGYDRWRVVVFYVLARDRFP